jgi:drug/metabolite transporter (DMT)-like permease
VNEFQDFDSGGGRTGYVGKRRGPWQVILLGLITCGIYTFYWYYQAMEDINRASGEQRINSAMLLILSIFCSPVVFVVLYKIDDQLTLLSKEEGVHYTPKYILWLLLTLILGVGPLVAVFQIIGAFNNIWDRREGIS